MSDQDKDLEQEIIEKEQTDDAPDTKISAISAAGRRAKRAK